MSEVPYNSINMISKLVSFDTTSRVSNLDLIHFIVDYLKEFGIESELIFNPEKTKANLFATIGPAEVPGIVLSGHTDVVPVDGQAWDTNPFELIERDGRLYGRGASDMKSFIGVVLAATPYFASKKLTTPIHYAFSFDEEIGCLGAPLLISKIKKVIPSFRAVIIGEPTEMAVVNAHKGVCGFKTTVSGLERHSSETHRGVNAVSYAAELIHKLTSMGEQIKNDRSSPESGFDPPYTTIHVGTIVGGTAQNIVPRSCSFTWEYRLMPDESETEINEYFQEYIDKIVLPKMHAVDPNTEIATEALALVPGLAPAKRSSAEELVLALARKNTTKVVSYGTEAGQFQQAGYSTVVCGPGSIAQAHKPNEYIEKSEVKACELFMGRLLNEVCRAK